MRFLVIEGTVRRGRRSIHAARYVRRILTQKGYEAELFDMDDYDIPLFRNRRYEASEQHPPDIETYGQKVEHADGLVIVTPEYNGSIPGALKNLVDHLYPEYNGKPFSYVTVSDGRFGGVRALESLQSITLVLKARPGPSLSVPYVQDVFGSDGEIVDEEYRARFEGFVEDAAVHTDEYS